ncbi:MAG: DUF1338 domain-containing protein [Bacteroidales bacterium]|nr:DUF1338 domain-containing protein [Bacteroidales bacterium]
MDHNLIFDKLWKEYSEINPSANNIHSLLDAEGENIVNDHVAFRTFDIHGIDIKALSTPFLKAGYVERGEYFFEAKRLRAKHYEHSTDKKAPKVFISELITSDFSEVVQAMAQKFAAATLAKINTSEELIFALSPWGQISYLTYKQLLEESEYAAWIYVWGFRANHFTIFINYLEKYRSIEVLNNYLKENGYTLNSSGGEIKGTKEQYLKQSSTLADIVSVDFTEGSFDIPCCYYEFAERFENAPGKLYTGFIASSADKIFESTDMR